MIGQTTFLLGVLATLASASVAASGVPDRGGDLAAVLPDSVLGPGDAVPFIAQGPLLCGGAAAAMVERYWGATNVYAEDYGSLVRPSEGGIRTTELARALERRGYDAVMVFDDSARVLEALSIGVPPIVLLDSNGISELHYVVLVEVDDDSVRVHDPNFGPGIRMSRADFMDRWAGTGHWALLTGPATRADAERSGNRTSGPDAAPRVPSPELATAMTLLRDGDLLEARARAASLMDRPPEEAELARRIIATSYYLAGEESRALDEWNVLGEPRVDLVEVSGARNSRYHALARRIGITHGDTLTSGALGTAARRLSDTPAVAASRIDYAPLPDGRVTVRASLVEPARTPDRIGLATQALRAIVHGEASLESGPWLAAADRWRVGAGWTPEAPFLTATVSTVASPLPGIVTVGVEWRRERYGAAGGPATRPDLLDRESRTRGWIGVREWVNPAVRLGAELGLERWERGPAIETFDRMASLTTSALWASPADRARIEGDATVWVGSDGAYGNVSLSGTAKIERGEHRSWRAVLGGSATSRSAPRVLWPGAGIGRIRAPLLRGDPLARGDAISGAAFAPRLLYATLEHRLTSRVGPLEAGAMIFADAAVVCGAYETGCDRPLVDPGVGFFVDAGGAETAINLARGSDGWVLSASFLGRR